MIKILKAIGVEGNVLNMMKEIYEKPTAMITLNGERLKVPLRSGEDKAIYLLLSQKMYSLSCSCSSQFCHRSGNQYLVSHLKYRVSDTIMVLSIKRK